MKINRKHVLKGISPYARISFARRNLADAALQNFAQNINIEVPENYSIKAAKAFFDHFAYLGEIPKMSKPVHEDKIPSWLAKKTPAKIAPNRTQNSQTENGEVSFKQIFDRIAGHYTYHGVKLGYFDQESDARNFYDELRYLLCTQTILPHIKKQIDLGLSWAYGDQVADDYIAQLPSLDEYRYAPKKKSHYAQTEGQYIPHASLLKNSGDIVGETLLKKSENENWRQFLSASRAIEQQPKMLKMASKLIFTNLQDFYNQTIEQLAETPYLTINQYHLLVAPLRKLDIDEGFIAKSFAFAKAGDYDGFKNEFAFLTDAADQPEEQLYYQYCFDKKNEITSISDIHDKDFVEEELLNQAYHNGNVEFFFNAEINQSDKSENDDQLWHHTGYFSNQKSSCQKISLNLLNFKDDQGQIKTDALEHALNIATIFADIMVDLAQHDDTEVKANNVTSRPIAINLMNGASLLMSMGIGYDSDLGLTTMANICQLSTSTIMTCSSEIAKTLGCAPSFESNKAKIYRQIDKLYDLNLANYPIFQDVEPQKQKQLSFLTDQTLLKACKAQLQDLQQNVKQNGLRNLTQAMMVEDDWAMNLLDCTSVAAEPVQDLYCDNAGNSKDKKLSQFVRDGLHHLGYGATQIKQIEAALCLKPSFKNTPYFNHNMLAQNGMSRKLIEQFDIWASTYDDVSAFLLPSNLTALIDQLPDLSLDEYQKASLNRMVKELDAEQLSKLNDVLYLEPVCNHIPHLDPLDYHVFFNLNPTQVKKFHKPLDLAQLNMISACQHFIDLGVSGKISAPTKPDIINFGEFMKRAKQLKLKHLFIQFDAEAPVRPLTIQELAEKIDAGKIVAAPLNESIDEKESEDKVELEVELDDVEFENKQTTQLGKKQVLQREIIHSNHFFIAGDLVILHHSKDENDEISYLKIDMPDQTLNVKDLLNQFSKAISFALQNGVRLSDFAHLFIGNHGVGGGKVESGSDIEHVNSVIDFTFQFFCPEMTPPPKYNKFIEGSNLFPLKPGTMEALMEKYAPENAEDNSHDYNSHIKPLKPGTIEALMKKFAPEDTQQSKDICEICGANENSEAHKDTICLKCKKAR